MNAKIKHIEIIQDTIKRLSNNSFLLKAWTVTIVSALIVLLAKEGKIIYIVTVLFPVIFFWMLDGYYLRQERLFRCLFNEIRNKEDNLIDFSMDTKSFVKEKNNRWNKIYFSQTLISFYGGIVLLIIALTVFTFI